MQEQNKPTKINCMERVTTDVSDTERKKSMLLKKEKKTSNNKADC